MEGEKAKVKIKKTTIAIWIIILIFSLAVIAIVYGLTKIFVISEKIIDRCPSPDGKVEAILVVRDGGATTSWVYNVYIVPKGGKYSGEDLIFSAEDDFQNVHINWSKNKLLGITYDKAEIAQFKNYWRNRGLENYKYSIEIQLKHL